MKRILFVLVVSVCAMSLVVAQDLANVQLKKSEMPVRHLSTAIPMLKKGQDKVKKMDGIVFDASQNAILKADEGSTWLNGSMTFFAVDLQTYEELSYKIRVQPDASDANKYWFWNLFNISTATDSIYATLSGNTLTFPEGQSFGDVYLTTGDTVFLSLSYWGQGSDGYIAPIDGNVQATVDEANGKIIFDKGIVGSLPEVESALSGTYYMEGAVAYMEGYEPLNLSYTLPNGTLFYGFTKSGAILPMLAGVGQPDATWEWNAICDNATADASYEWEFFKVGDEAMTYVEGQKLAMDVKAGEEYLFPILAVESGHVSGIYQEGMNLFYDEASGVALAHILAGGQSMEAQLQGEGGQTVTETLNLTNANIDRQYRFEMLSEDSYVFGSGYIPVSETQAIYMDGAAARYEKPIAPLSFAGVDVLCDVYSGGTDKLELTVVTIKEGVEGELGGFVVEDTIASSKEYSITMWSAEGGQESASMLSFRNFVKRDAAGFETEVGRMKFSDKPFALILSGCGPESGVTLGIASEAIYGNENYAYSMIPLQDGGSISTAWNINTHLFMLLTDAVYGEGQSSVASVEANTTKLFSTSDAFNFTYTDDFTSVDVYNVNGQKVSSYALPQTGTFSIVKAGLADGVYMFRMNGKTTEVLRAVK